jgi:glycolate oxidase
VTSEMRRILDIDLANQRAVVEPGVHVPAVAEAVRPGGYLFAPDQRTPLGCTIGGNVAENAGGAHCLTDGFAAHHVTGVELCTPLGDLVWLGAGKAAECAGYDLLGVLVGAEGTLGVVTKVALRLVRAPEAVVTVLAAFRTPEEAGAAVGAVMAAGLNPSAAEVIDGLAVEVAGWGFPLGAGAVLIVECAGPAVEVTAQVADLETLCRRAGAFALRRATDEAERVELWRGRASALAAVRRLVPDAVVRDGVLPRARLAEVLRGIGALARDAGVRVANIYHAGDGNLHPLVLFDRRMAGATEAAERVSGAIVDLCVAHGGADAGARGAGLDLDIVRRVRRAFDPRHLANPRKPFPTPRLCGEPR